MAKYCIDAGHNYSGVDTGAVGALYKEQDLSFRIASALKKLLENAGHEVKMTRETPTSNIPCDTVAESLLTRAKISNDFGADYFISIHLNAGGGVGSETYVLANGGKAEALAEKIQASFEALGRVNRGVKVRNLAVLRLTKCPAVLVEVGFIDNAAEEAWIADNADAIALSIAESLGVKAERECMSAVEAIAYLKSRNIITEPDKWYSGTWNDEDMKWLLRKCAQYIKDNM